MTLETIVIENIKRIRKEKKISQEMLAEACETSTSYIGLMETYRNIPKLSTIERIAEALNVPAIELFRESTENQKKSSPPEKSKSSKSLATRLKREIIASMEKELDEILKMV